MVDILECLELLAAIFDDLLRAQQKTDVGGVRVTDGDDLTAPAIGVLFPCGAIKRRISVRDRDRTDPLDHGIEVNPAVQLWTTTSPPSSRTASAIRFENGPSNFSHVSLLRTLRDE